MEIINRKQRMFSISRKLRRESRTVGFVPTMGALHEGHLALIKEARLRSDVVIVSIFINPEQFNEQSDFDSYPSNLTADAAMLAEYEVDYVFVPERSEIYPEGFATFVTVDGLAERFEGESRPGHFRGVATVVAILFNTVRPDLAFFGQKDAQQVAVIRRMSRDLGFETEIVIVPTVREDSGLAMSSRNERLTSDDRKKASVLNAALSRAKEAFENGDSNASHLTQIVTEALESEPAARLDYVAVVDRETIEPIEKVGKQDALILAAAYFGPVRLIDNALLENKQ